MIFAKTAASVLAATFILVHGWQGDKYFNQTGIYIPISLSQNGETVTPDALIDTGSNSFIVPSFVEKELNLQPDNVEQISGIDGSETDHIDAVNVTIGGRMFQNVQVVVSPNVNVVFLGMGFLRGIGVHTLTLNLDTNSVRINIK